MSNTINAYSDEELQKFDAILDEKIAETKKNIAFLSAQIQNNHHGTDDTATAFNVMEASQLSSAQENLSMQLVRENKFLEALLAAKRRIKSKTYGICRVTGALIPKERLYLVPHATLSVEGKKILEKGGN